MRLIDADELIERAYRERLDSRELIAQMIETAPTADAVSVVRCKDCVCGCAYNEKWYLPKRDGWWCCIREEEVEQKDYCSRGVRMTDDG